MRGNMRIRRDGKQMMIKGEGEMRKGKRRERQELLTKVRREGERG